MTRLVVVLAALAACGKGKQAAPPSGSGSSVAAVREDAVAIAPAEASIVDGAVDTATEDARFFPARRTTFTANEGIILAEKQGGVVEGIPDGSKVEVVKVKDMLAGAPMTGEVQVTYNGRTVTLSPTRVLLARDLFYSPDDKYVVSAPLTTCKIVCGAELWLVGADGRRTKLGEGNHDVYTAWNGETLAVSAGVLWVVSLADFKVTKFPRYMSPSFSPAGVLYVRDEDGSAYTLIDGNATRVWKTPKPHEDDDPYHVDGPPPVKWKNGKPDYSTTFGADDAE